MKFGWISVFGAIIAVLMLIPNIAYAITNKNEKNRCENRFMNLIEQLGRYACIVLMWLPFPVRKLAFASVFEMALYLAGSGTLLAAYWISFAVYMKRRTAGLALALAIIPACIFLLGGLLLRHWLLVGFAVLFAVGHVFVTVVNAKQLSEERRDEV